MATKTYTTAEAATQIGVSRQTLFNWIARERVAAPKPVQTGRRTVRFWTKPDIEKARKFKGTLKHGPIPRKK